MFLIKDDLRSSIRANRLAQILDDDTGDEILTDVLATAEQTVRDHLHQHYDIEAIFAQAGASRKKNVLRWCKLVAIYQLYERIPDELVPERVVKDYNECMDFLMKVAEGQVPVELPRRTVANDDGTLSPKTKFRWGSQPKRSY